MSFTLKKNTWFIFKDDESIQLEKILDIFDYDELGDNQEAEYVNHIYRIKPLKSDEGDFYLQVREPKYKDLPTGYLFLCWQEYYDTYLYNGFPEKARICYLSISSDGEREYTQGHAYKYSFYIPYDIELTDEQYKWLLDNVSRIEFPEEPKFYTITFDANGGSYSGGTKTVTERTNEDGRVVYAPQRPTWDDGDYWNIHGFNGYNTQKSGSGDAVTFGNDGYRFSDDTTVYAQWIDLQRFQVQFIPNGGTLTGPSYVITLTNGKLPYFPTDPIREGYKFLGWFTASTGGARITEDTIFVRHTNAFAHWEKISGSGSGSGEGGNEGGDDDDDPNKPGGEEGGDDNDDPNKPGGGDNNEDDNDPNKPGGGTGEGEGGEGVEKTRTPIKIPSKNIYYINDQKVIDNQIDKVEVQTKNITPYSQYETNVGSFAFEDDIKIKNGETQSDLQGSETGMGGYSISVAAAYVELTPSYTTKTIRIPILGENSRVLSILTGLDKNDNPNIKCTMYGDIEIGNAAATVHLRYGEATSITNQKLTENEEETKKATGTSYTLQNNMTVEQDAENGSGLMYTHTKASVTLESESDVGTVQAKTVNIDDVDYFEITATYLAGLKKISMSGGETVTSSISGTYEGDISVSGDYQIYIPKKIEITVYGNTIGIELKDENITINENGSNVVSFMGNELMQSTNKPSIEETYGEIISQWKDGKEVATIRCGIENYYDVNGDMAISNSGTRSLPMTFHIGDIVIPYVYGANGKDKPMSLKQDGFAKTFEVLGKKIIYDGAIWQELTLQEKIE